MFDREETMRRPEKNLVDISRKKTPDLPREVTKRHPTAEVDLPEKNHAQLIFEVRSHRIQARMHRELSNFYSLRAELKILTRSEKGDTDLAAVRKDPIV